MSHWLVILEQGEDYEIEHLPDCPTEDWIVDPDGNKIMFHTCLVGSLVHEAGIDDLEWRSLPVGRYEIKGWTERSPAGPWGPEEWDAGLEFIGKESHEAGA